MNEQYYGAEPRQSAIGFENAAAEYESRWTSHQSAQIVLDVAESEVSHTKARMEEALDALDKVATEFNSTGPQVSGYEALQLHLDVARDHMLAATDDYEAACAHWYIVGAQYDNSVRGISESFDVVKSLRSQLDSEIYAGDAANDASYELEDVLDTLSDSARYLYNKVA